MNCNRCFRRCEIPPGGAGYCGAGVGQEPYGLVTSIVSGPIEERAIFHYRPGSTVMMAGMVGCNLGCSFCMNPEVSQPDEPATCLFLPPGKLVEKALECGADGIGFSFSEPLVSRRYVSDVFREAGKAGLYRILKTNGAFSRGELLSVALEADAVNVDYKGTADTYLRLCDAPAEAYDMILQNLSELAKMDHLEVSTLVFAEGELRDQFDELSDAVGQDVPIHLIRFVPMHKMMGGQCPSAERMLEAFCIAREYFSHAYLHTRDARNYTTCPECDAILADRAGTKLIPNDKYVVGCSACRDVIRGDNPCFTTTSAKDAEASSR